MTHISEGDFLQQGKGNEDDEWSRDGMKVKTRQKYTQIYSEYTLNT